MGNKQNEKQIKIKQIIAARSDNKLLYLDIWNQPDHWQGVLNVRDWSPLKELILVMCKIQDDKFEVISNKQWPYLTKLDLSGNKLTQKSMKKLIKTQILNMNNLNKLNVLSLSFNPIGDHGIKLLAKLNLPQLNILHLESCQIVGEGFRYMIKSKWANLLYLFLTLFNDKSTYSIILCPNRIRLHCWQKMEQYQWSKLKELLVYQAQPICLMNLVFIECSQMYVNRFEIKNRMLSLLINEVLLNRKIITR